MIVIKSGRERPRTRYYICDRKRCDNCAALCRHTADITHALYDDHPDEGFSVIDGVMWEKPRGKSKADKRQRRKLEHESRIRDDAEFI